MWYNIKKNFSEDYMTKADKAREYFKQGYACSQAVAMAFSDVAGFDEGQLARILLPFGGGLGRLRLTCGAVSGMAAILGAVYSEEGSDPENKLHIYEITRELCDEFKARCGSLICSELLEEAGVDSSAGGAPEARTEQYYKKRPCDEIVYIAADILEKYLDTHPRG